MAGTYKGNQRQRQPKVNRSRHGAVRRLRQNTQTMAVSHACPFLRKHLYLERDLFVCNGGTLFSLVSTMVSSRVVIQR